MKQGKGKWWSSLKKEELIQIAPLLLNALHLKENKVGELTLMVSRLLKSMW